jgi:hypothetical protein
MPKPCQVRSHLASYMIDGNALKGELILDISNLFVSNLAKLP